MNDFKEDLDVLRDAVEAAGAMALDYFHGDVKHWEKAPGDPVSEADHAVNDLLEARLRSARPDYGWLSEETTDAPDRLALTRIWVVDPIDGTRAFIERRPEFSVAAALVDDGRPVAGIVFNPATSELFEATKDGGARLNGKPIVVSGHAALEGAKLISGSRMFERAGWDGPPEGATFASINSIAYRMSLVAAGRYDACISLGSKSEWDVAAADLIVAEAGGRTTTAKGKAIAYNQRVTVQNSIVVAGPALHATLMDFLETVPRPPGVRW